MLLLVCCFNWLCLVQHIPSICTDLIALAKGNHVTLMTEDKLLLVLIGGRLDDTLRVKDLQNCLSLSLLGLRLKEK